MLDIVSKFLICVLVISEALERLLLRRFRYEKSIQVPNELTEISSDPDLYTCHSCDRCQGISTEYHKFRTEVYEGSLGKTAQFWVLYMDLVRNQHYAHVAVQSNNFDLRLFAWEYMIPFYFALNKVNYARYGSYYLQQMKNIQTLYPGLKSLLEHKGLSVQAQNRYAIRTAIDQRGEQTINRDAKTSGGIKSFA